MKTNIILIALVAVLVVGGSYYYFTEVSISEEQKIVRAMQNTWNLDSYTMDLDLGVNFVSQDGEEVEFDISNVSNVDNVNEASQGEINLDMNFSNGLMGPLSVGAQFIMADEAFYAKMDDVPGNLLQGMEMVTGMEEKVSGFVGEWILLMEDLDELQEYTEEDEDVDISERDLRKLKEKFEELINEFFKQKVIYVESKETDEINGKKMDKYSISSNPERFPKFYEKEIIPFLYFISKEIEKVSETEIESRREEWQRIKEELDDINMEEAERLVEDMEFYIWVGENRIHRVIINMDIRGDDYQDFEEESLFVTMDLSFSNFNESFNIVAPENYLTIEDIITEIMTDMMMPVPMDSFPQFDDEMPGLEELEGFDLDDFQGIPGF